MISDQTKDISAFKWTLYEVERRQKQFAEKEVRDIQVYNEQMGFEAIPHILIITFADVYTVETEDARVRLTAQGSRAGIHNIIITNHTGGALLLSSTNLPRPQELHKQLHSALLLSPLLCEHKHAEVHAYLAKFDRVDFIYYM